MNPTFDFRKKNVLKKFLENEFKPHSTHISPYLKKSPKLPIYTDLSQPNPAGWILTDNLLWMTSSCGFCNAGLPNYSTSKLTLLILEFHCPKINGKVKQQHTNIFLPWMSIVSFRSISSPIQTNLVRSLFPATSFSPQATHAMEVTLFLCEHPCSQRFRCKSISNSPYKSVFTRSLAQWSAQENTERPNDLGHKVHENHVCHLVFIPPFFFSLIS